uniref:CHASE domain-containing protein n=1 Tax=Chromera velia CCMP2878 TaxID=1169474 RepID=A0A0G4H2A7_9ALVE|eukprot:Cvel_24377.t1-p1 / transcript=Cvel_24377.t1 / gene=Cvel_24377 / organism=Chromera_velia_CCMP2878 / gene_product=hypothetical protein / transcript_product=hypothetical protein / location=Cvel_scaffold2626:17040-24110(-) / protein_length=1318 / sequence_SO=supercontig / SO=protein_coding / is_pseudo=false
MWSTHLTREGLFTTQSVRYTSRSGCAGTRCGKWMAKRAWLSKLLVTFASFELLLLFIGALGAVTFRGGFITAALDRAQTQLMVLDLNFRLRSSHIGEISFTLCNDDGLVGLCVNDYPDCEQLTSVSVLSFHDYRKENPPVWQGRSRDNFPLSPLHPSITRRDALIRWVVTPVVTVSGDVGALLVAGDIIDGKGLNVDLATILGRRGLGQVIAVPGKTTEGETRSRWAAVEVLVTDTGRQISASEIQTTEDVGSIKDSLGGVSDPAVLARAKGVIRHEGFEAEFVFVGKRGPLTEVKRAGGQVETVERLRGNPAVLVHAEPLDLDELNDVVLLITVFWWGAVGLTTIFSACYLTAVMSQLLKLRSPTFGYARDLLMLERIHKKIDYLSRAKEDSNDLPNSSPSFRQGRGKRTIVGGGKGNPAKGRGGDPLIPSNNIILPRTSTTDRRESMESQDLTYQTEVIDSIRASTRTNRHTMLQAILRWQHPSLKVLLLLAFICLCALACHATATILVYQLAGDILALQAESESRSLRIAYDFSFQSLRGALGTMAESQYLTDYSTWESNRTDATASLLEGQLQSIAKRSEAEVASLFDASGNLLIGPSDLPSGEGGSFLVTVAAVVEREQSVWKSISLEAEDLRKLWWDGWSSAPAFSRLKPGFVSQQNVLGVCRPGPYMFGRVVAQPVFSQVTSSSGGGGSLVGVLGALDVLDGKFDVVDLGLESMRRGFVGVVALKGDQVENLQTFKVKSWGPSFSPWSLAARAMEWNVVGRETRVTGIPRDQDVRGDVIPLPRYELRQLLRKVRNSGEGSGRAFLKVDGEVMEVGACRVSPGSALSGRGAGSRGTRGPSSDSVQLEESREIFLLRGLSKEDKDTFQTAGFVLGACLLFISVLQMLALPFVFTVKIYRPLAVARNAFAAQLQGHGTAICVWLHRLPENFPILPLSLTSNTASVVWYLLLHRGILDEQQFPLSEGRMLLRWSRKHCPEVLQIRRVTKTFWQRLCGWAEPRKAPDHYAKNAKRFPYSKRNAGGPPMQTLQDMPTTFGGESSISPLSPQRLGTQNLARSFADVRSPTASFSPSPRPPQLLSVPTAPPEPAGLILPIPKLNSKTSNRGQLTSSVFLATSQRQREEEERASRRQVVPEAVIMTSGRNFRGVGGSTPMGGGGGAAAQGPTHSPSAGAFGAAPGGNESVSSVRSQAGFRGMSLDPGKFRVGVVHDPSGVSAASSVLKCAVDPSTALNSSEDFIQKRIAQSLKGVAAGGPHEREGRPFHSSHRLSPSPSHIPNKAPSPSGSLGPGPSRTAGRAPGAPVVSFDLQTGARQS